MEDVNQLQTVAEITHLQLHKITFALFIEGRVAATDAAIIVVADAFLVNAAF